MSEGIKNNNRQPLDTDTCDNICLVAINTSDIDSNRHSFGKLFNASTSSSSSSSTVNANTNVNIGTAALNTICKCESQYEINRVKCLVDAYRTLLQHRAKPMNIDRYHKLLNTRELCAVQLMDIEVATLTEELAETQILYTFLRQYIKNHPKFLEWGPPLSEIKIKSDFYSST